MTFTVKKHMGFLTTEKFWCSALFTNNDLYNITDMYNIQTINGFCNNEQNYNIDNIDQSDICACLNNKKFEQEINNECDSRDTICNHTYNSIKKSNLVQMYFNIIFF